jgi:hypothetical protein
MGSLIQKLLWFFGRNLINFSIIALVLAFGTFLYNDAKEKLATRSTYKNWQSEADSFANNQREDAKHRISQTGGMGQAKIEERISAIDAELKANEERLKAFSISPQAFVEKQKIGISNSYLTQEKAHLTLMRDRIKVLSNRDSAEKRLAVLRGQHVNAYKAYQAYLPTYEQCRDQWHGCSKIISSHREIVSRHDQLLADVNDAHTQYQHQKVVMDSLKIPAVREFALSDAASREQKAKLDEAIVEIENDWLIKTVDLLKAVAMQALIVLAGIILIPIAIKAFLYFVMARYAARRPAVCVLPDTGCLTDGVVQTGKISSVSVDIDFDSDEELLLHQDYVLAAPTRCSKDMKWVLNRTYFLTSLAAGMYGLTRFRSDSPARVIACPQADPLAEIGIVDIPEGCAMVFEPHNLIGVVQRRDIPMRISSHWRLFSSTAWLTMQFRVLVFHGPARLVVQGCRGVKLEWAGDGSIINQGATIGYSANLNHSVERSEVFPPYLWGKEELLNDRFDGSGIFAYAQAPFLGKKHGLFGRGIEGVLDSALKVFGV